MKNIYFILTVLFLGLFQIQGQTLTDSLPGRSKSSLYSGMDLQIIGKWNIYADFSEFVSADSVTEKKVTFCNVCPSIVFYKNFTATFINFSEHNEIYNWSIKADSLYLEYQGDPAIKPYFPSQKYKMILKNINTNLELQLFTSETSGYILSKEIKNN